MIITKQQTKKKNIKQYLKPLNDDGTLPKAVLSPIVTKIDSFITVNSIILESLKAKSKEASIGEVFCSLADYLKVYTGYSSQQTTIMTTIISLQHKKSDFRNLLKVSNKRIRKKLLLLLSHTSLKTNKIFLFQNKKQKTKTSQYKNQMLVENLI